MNHVDVVTRIHDAEPASTWQSADGMLGFVLRVIAALPASEHAGLVKAPQGGENVAHYAPADKWVRVNRVMYADGLMAKILMDSGVGGANTPAWNESDDDPGLYVPVTLGPVPVPIPEPPPDDDDEQIAALKLDVAKLKDELKAAVELSAGLESRILKLEQKPAPVFDLPDLVVEGKTSTMWGHQHAVNLAVKKRT